MRQIFLILCLMLLTSCVTAQEPRVCFDQKCVNVLIAQTEIQVRKGLSGHAPLKADQGMLFVFEKEGLYTFWMHDMTFPLDIIWLDRSGKIVHIEENIPPCSKDACSKYIPKVPALYVLEVNAGYVNHHLLKLNIVAKIHLSSS